MTRLDLGDALDDRPGRGVYRAGLHAPPETRDILVRDLVAELAP